MTSPSVTIIGSISPVPDDGYLLVELSQPIVLTDLTTPTIQYKTLPMKSKALISTTGRLVAEGYTDPTSNPFTLPPCQGVLVSPNSGAYYKVKTVTTIRGRKAESFEVWTLDSSVSSIEIGDIPAMTDIPKLLDNRVPGDLEILGAGTGVILKSVGGQRFRIYLEDDGTFAVSSIV